MNAALPVLFLFYQKQQKSLSKLITKNSKGIKFTNNLGYFQTCINVKFLLFSLFQYEMKYRSPKEIAIRFLFGRLIF